MCYIKHLKTFSYCVLLFFLEQNLENTSDLIDKSVDIAVAPKGSNCKLQNTGTKISGLHMKDQLMYLANLLGFEVIFHV